MDEEMTFTEAAVEVLRLVGRPLHYKKITEVAIERNLLSHVGKSPEITMNSRLATMVKKDRGDAPIVKVKPGIFGLREFSKEVLAMGELEEGDVEDILEAIDEADAGEAEAAGVETDEATAGAQPVAAAPEAEKPEKVQKPVHKLPGQEVFPEEEDDDEPILGRPDESTGEAGESEESRRNKKRRRKKRRGGEGESAPADEPRESGREDRHRDRDRHRERGDRERDRGERERDRERARDDRHRERDRGPRREPEIRGDWQREPAEGDLSGKDLSDAIESALSSRGGKSLFFVEIADILVQRGRLQGDASALAPTIAAAVRGDVARRNATGLKPRFRVRFGEVSLLDQLLGGEVARAEQDAMRSLQRHRELVHRALVRKLQELPNSSLLEVLATWLNAVGVTSLRGVRRSGAGAGEFHLAGVMRRGQEEVPVAIVIVRDGQVGRERVIDVRGSLHRYGDARLAWIVALGNVQGGARDEASEPGGAPVAVYDGMQLARSLEDAGVGVRRFSLPLLMVDFDLFDELRGPGAPQRAPREPQRMEPRVARAAEPEVEEDFEDEEGAEAESEGAEGAESGAEKGESAEAGEGGNKRRRRRRRRRRTPDAREGAATTEEGAGEATAGESARDEDEEEDEDTLASGEISTNDEGREDARIDEDEERLRDDDERDLDEDDLDRDLDEDDRDLDLDEDDLDLDREDDDLDRDSGDDRDGYERDEDEPELEVDDDSELDDEDDDEDDDRTA